MGRLVDDLRSEGTELRETHISWVFLRGADVYKVKKPVALGFLDFSTLELRRAACEAELTLNRRLAADVYLDLLPVTRDERGVHHIAGAGATVDWAVHMRRLADADCAEQRLRANTLSGEDIAALARRLAEFHAHSRCDATTSAFGTPEAIAANVQENFAQTQSSVQEHLSADAVAEIQRFQLGFLESRAVAVRERIAMSRVRDGHGDLRLEHVYFERDREPSIIDCIEFNERFRYGDVCADLAFLVMDLGYHERDELAELLLATYARASGDYALYGLVDFYQSYRAYVRGKVSSFVAADEDASAEVRERARAQARKYFVLAQAYARPRMQRPLVLAIGGMIASGKSTLAEHAAVCLQAPIVESDRTRKQLADVAPAQRLQSAAFAGEYSEDASRGVYAELLRRASFVVDSGRSVVLDASFRSTAERAAVREWAARHEVDLVFVECVASETACRQRLREREGDPNVVSDAREGLYDAFAARFEPMTELAPSAHVMLDGSGSAQSLCASFDRWLRARNGGESAFDTLPPAPT